MTVLAFEVVGAQAERHAAAPTVTFRLRIRESTGAAVHAMVAQAQVRIEPQRRSYDAEEEARLYELFGETPQWGDSLRPFLWTHASCTVGAFSGEVEVDLPIACTYDFEVAAAKYLHALAGGEIPLIVLFSGTVFSRGGGGLSVERIGWEQEARYRLPARVWRETMDQYFPNGGWIRVDRGVLDQLRAYRAAEALPTWDQALERLLKLAERDR